MVENTPQQETSKKNMSPMILGVLLGIVFLVVGFAGGYFLSQGGDEETQLEKLLSLSAVNSFQMISSGEITEITKNTLTITRSGEEITLKISDEAKIIKTVYPTPEELENTGQDSAPRAEEITLDELKTGDPVMINSIISADGSTEVSRVMLLGSKRALPPL